MTEKPLHATTKNPVILTISDSKTDFHSGCKVIDINFPNITNPEIGEIHFKNSYTAFITLRAKCKGSSENGESSGEAKWKTCIRRFRLMPNPHMEEGSQDFYCLGRKHFLCDISNIVLLRVILQQPSPVWKDFKIEDLKIYRPADTNKPPPLPSWLTEDSGKPKKQDSVPNLESISSSLQHLWALAEEVGNRQTDKSLGRYEVDGCYEINLLSYT